MGTLRTYYNLLRIFWELDGNTIGTGKKKNTKELAKPPLPQN
jgi:hypothetical protein